MYVEKEIEGLASLVKENSTQVPHSRVVERSISKSPVGKAKSRNSKSEKSLSRGKQNHSVAAIVPPR